MAGTVGGKRKMNGFSIVLFLLVIMVVSVLPEEKRPTETEEEDDDGIIKLLHFDVILSL